MRSPFPGMDPYLEEPILWSGFHSKFINMICEMVLPQVVPTYWVEVEERVYVDLPDDAGRHVGPDVMVTRTAAPPAPIAAGGLRAAAPSAVVEVPILAPYKEHSVKILRRGDRAVITVIEVLSPANKRRSGTGRAMYLAKRNEILASATHLVEIDLLRGGERPPVKDALPPSEYAALVHRKERRPVADVFSMRLRDRLPVLPIPLGEGDPDAALDLGDAVHRTYERGRYDVELDYRGEADPPLDGEAAAWAAGILRRGDPSG